MHVAEYPKRCMFSWLHDTVRYKRGIFITTTVIFWNFSDPNMIFTSWVFILPSRLTINITYRRRINFVVDGMKTSNFAKLLYSQASHRGLPLPYSCIRRSIQILCFLWQSRSRTRLTEFRCVYLATYFPRLNHCKFYIPYMIRNLS